MNELQKAYVDGAAIAYRDVAQQIIDMINRAPAQIKPVMECLKPIAQACLAKSKDIYIEVDRMQESVKQ